MDHGRVTALARCSMLKFTAFSAEDVQSVTSSDADDAESEPELQQQAEQRPDATCTRPLGVQHFMLI